jgi:hypothetical protein
MKNWWEAPYKGGPMVMAAAMFPRPLYPPDATSSGKAPSVDGPDVEAYKRTVWRAGRWLGPASEFDRAYSNGFAHGKSGNVAETGIAGVQRQQHITPTGWVGQATFNTLASLRVPTGPHAGEMAMDANAANLIAQAFELYGGKAPAPDPPASLGSIRAQALEAATRDLGYVESPPESNRTKYGQWYGMDGQPWCAMAVTSWYLEAGPSSTFREGQTYAYVPYIVSDARNQRNGLTVATTPLPGDLVCYDWGRDGTFDHVGLFEAWAGSSPSAFTAIEGNTSAGNDSNGGKVMRRDRDTRNQSTVFVRVAE